MRPGAGCPNGYTHLKGTSRGDGGPMQSTLIKDTTREERRQIVRQGLSCGDDTGCDQCSGCSMGIGSLEAMYQPYIDGKLELAEVNMLHAAHSYTHG